MLSDIYNSRILELAGNIPRLGRLEAPDASATAHSKLCGSTVTVDLVVEDGRVADFAHEVRACALGQASAAIMAQHVVGSSPGELRALRDTMRRMLKEGARRVLGRVRRAGADPGLQGSPRLDAADVICRGRLARSSGWA